MAAGGYPSPEADALFDAYLDHCHILLAEAQAWAAKVPEHVQAQLHKITVRRDLLEFLPRMPTWLAEHVGESDIFISPDKSGNENEIVEWAGHRFFNPRTQVHAIVPEERIAEFRREERAFLNGIGRLDWLQEADPAAECLAVPGLAALVEKASAPKPTRRWEAEARAMIEEAGAARVASETSEWLAALGPADAHKAATPGWMQVGTLRVLVAEMERTLTFHVVGAWRSVMELSARPLTGERLAGLHICKTKTGRTENLDLALQAAHWQFGYWGHPPAADPDTGLCSVRSLGWVPGDTRRLSTSNSNRARGVVWLLARAHGADAADRIAAAADSLAVKVYHESHVAQLLPRSLVGAKACLEVLAGFGDSSSERLLRDLAARIDHPPLHKAIVNSLALQSSVGEIGK